MAVSAYPTAAVRRLAAAWPHSRASNGRWLTRYADLVRLGLLCGAVLFLAAGDGSDALKALLLTAPSLSARLLRVNPALDLAFALALAAEGVLGGAVPWIAGDDTLPHIVLPLLSGPVLYAGLLRLGALAKPAARPTAALLMGSAAATAMSVIALGAAWELIEWVADATVETNYSQGYQDTLEDLVNDSIGAACAGSVVGVWLWIAWRKSQLWPIVGASKRASLPQDGRGTG